MEIKNLVFSLLYQAPMLLVYLTATILGLVFLGKYKTPALLVMLGGLTAGLVSLGAFVVREVLWAKAREDGEFEQVVGVTQVTGICGSLFEAVGVGLIVFGAFAGRKATTPGYGPPDEDEFRGRASRPRS